MVAGLGEPVETGDEGPKGLLISYVNLPSCPLCRGRIHLAPHVADPMGLDNFPNNHPDPTKAPQYYYDDYEGLAPHEVQTFVFDAAEAAIAAVDNMESDDDDEDDAAEDDDDDDEEQQWRDEPLDDPLGTVDNDCVFNDDPAAPDWVREWRGPSTIRIRRERQQPTLFG